MALKMVSMPALDMNAFEDSDEDDQRDATSMMEMLLKIKAAKSKSSE
jgi:hypothetical protein